MREEKEKVKFMFDNVFRAEDAPVVVNAPRKKHELTDEEIDAIRAEARAEGEAIGHQRGYAEAEASIEQQTAQTLAAIGEALGASFVQLEQENREVREFAARLSLLAARKLAARLIAERPQAEIEAVIEECVTHLNREPHLVLRVADGLSGLLKGYVDRLCHERGMSEQVLLIGDPEVAFGDCHVEWADGGITRSLSAIDGELTQIVDRYVQSLKGESETATAPAAQKEPHHVGE